MNLEMDYLGLRLSNPLMASSSGLTANMESIMSLAEAGVGAIVLKSIFEEEIMGKTLAEEKNYNTSGHPEADLYAHKISFEHQIARYIELLHQAKKQLAIPVIASINCSLHGEWLDFAKRLEDEGADALELNLAIIPDSIEQSPMDIEKKYVKIVEKVSEKLSIPLTVKLGAMFTNPAYLAAGLARAGARGVVLFNRFQNLYLDQSRNRQSKLKEGQWLSAPGEKAPVKLWISRIYGELGLDLSATSGVRNAADILELIEAGASTVQVASAFYLNGSEHARTILTDLREILKQEGVKSLKERQGTKSRKVVQKDNKYDRKQYYEAISVLNEMR